MRLRSIAAALAALSIGSLSEPAMARVVVFGIDGGSWPLVDRGIAAGDLPHLAALAARGVTAEMTTVEPVISPTVWTSIATGRSPAAHGVGDFFRNRTHVLVPTVFERMAAQGRRVGLYEWLVTWPPRTLPRGFVIPDWLRRDTRVTPPDVFARAGLAPWFYEVEGLESLDRFAELARAEVREKPERFVRLSEAFALDVGAVSFYAADAVGHRFWRAAFPEQFETPRTADEERLAGVLPETLRGIDAALGRVVASLAPDDAIIVVSDHGFQAQAEPRRIWSTRFREAFAAENLEPERDGFAIDGTFMATFVRVLPGPVEMREATLAKLCALLEGATNEAGEPLVDVDVLEVAERPAAQRAGWWRRLRALAIGKVLTWWYQIEHERPAYAIVLARPRDAALSAAWPDGTIRFGARGMPVRTLFTADDFTGTHDATAIFLAGGGPIAHRPARDRLSVLDVAPLLLHLAGLPIPDDLEGALPERMLDPELLAQRPVRRVPATALPGLPDEPAGAGVDDAVLLERLRALGYAE
jgi:arylsulfatase A-like enzyme